MTSMIDLDTKTSFINKIQSYKQICLSYYWDNYGVSTFYRWYLVDDMLNMLNAYTTIKFYNGNDNSAMEISLNNNTIKLNPPSGTIYYTIYGIK